MNAYQVKISDNFGERFYVNFNADMETAIRSVRNAVAEAADDPVKDVRCLEAKLIEGEVVMPAIKLRDPSEQE